jgi:membrane-bound lytic murein transglycosylase B
MPVEPVPPPQRRYWEDHPSAAADAARRSWANTTDRSARTAPARAAQLARYLDQVDPEHVLPEDERRQRAEQARRAWYRAIGRLGQRARRQRRDGEVDNAA